METIVEIIRYRELGDVCEVTPDSVQVRQEMRSLAEELSVADALGLNGCKRNLIARRKDISPSEPLNITALNKGESRILLAWFCTPVRFNNDKAQIAHIPSIVREKLVSWRGKQLFDRFKIRSTKFFGGVIGERALFAHRASHFYLLARWGESVTGGLEDNRALVLHYLEKQLNKGKKKFRVKLEMRDARIFKIEKFLERRYG